ncbi:hypothetical protein HDU87_006202 [Geranomyces variabilis]|uniref:G domain-containing protein n=1 Tax=Geranomyces variabilis TaxID=109894 RepID=A0AAD5TG45_9FUNG|nr:hypothetical protein HDU87_006202 [Geranomyces variabilis]
MRPATPHSIQTYILWPLLRNRVGSRALLGHSIRCPFLVPSSVGAGGVLARQQSTRPLRRLSAEGKPTTRVGPKLCTGCGAPFQTTTPDAPGYYPTSRDSKPRPPSVHAATATTPREDGTLTPSELRALLQASSSAATGEEARVCKRCHDLRHSNMQRKRVYPDADKLLADVRVNAGGLVVCIVDVTDYPASVVRELSQLVGVEKPILLVGNKVDLLPPEIPRDVLVRRLKKVAVDLGIVNLRDVLLTSAHDGSGLFELCEAVAPVQAQGHNVYLVGQSNVGKSAIVQALREMAGLEKDRGPTASIMPGTTVGMVEIDMDLSQFAPPSTGVASEEQHVDDPAKPTPSPGGLYDTPPGVASEEQHVDNPAKPTPSPGRLYDTPGLYSPNQITHALNARELRIAIPRKPLRAQPHTIKVNHTVFLGGLYRLDIIYAPNPVHLVFFTATSLPIHPCRTSRADALYAKHLGATDSPIMFPPIGPARARAVPKLERLRMFKVTDAIDLCFGGLGWVHIHGQAHIVAYTPGGAPVILSRDPLFTPRQVFPKWMKHKWEPNQEPEFP